MPLTPNSPLGRYQIRSLLGKGGMGEVYLAEDTSLRRLVAIKLLPDDVVEAPLRLRRFEREAYAASSLNHPNILTIYEIGKADGHHFIASEYVEGQDLRQHMARRSMTLKQIVETTIQVASALAAAEREGIVHRDIKPENIMIRNDGYVKVLDFGLAKLIGKGSDEHWGHTDREAPTMAMTSTSPGTVMGTVAYMSPEQARGKDLDARSDIWSLGVVLYEMVSGNMPFNGETSSDLVAAILKTEPEPLRHSAPGVPPMLNDIVNKMLCKDQKGRYQSSKQLLIDLETLKQELQFAQKSDRTQPQSISREEVGANGQLGKVRLNGEVSIAQPASRIEQFTTGIKRHKLGVTLMVAALVIPLAAVGYYRKQPSSPVAINSLAVLPFANESGDQKLDYLSEGLSENLRDHVSELPRLRVIGRPSSLRFRGANADPEDVADALGVQAIVVGRLIQRGDVLQVRVELIDGRDSSQIWGEEYSGSVAEILRLQTDISRKVAEKLRPEAAAEDQKPVASTKGEEEAYQLYLKGKYSWNKLTEEELNRSIDYFNQALEKNPRSALAYSGLATSYLTLGANDLPPQETYPKAREFAKKALELDETVAEAHYAMAATEYYDWDFVAAEKELARCLALNPNNVMAQALRSSIYLARGQTDIAITQLKQALEIDPYSLLLNNRLSSAYYFARDYNRALGQLNKTLELDSEATWIHSDLCMVHAQMSKFEEALASCQKAIILKKDDPAALTALGVTYALWGKKSETEWILRNLKELEKKKYVQPYDLAGIYAALGDKDQAMTLLDKAAREHSFMHYFRIDPVFDKLRSDPRYHALVKRIDSTH